MFDTWYIVIDYLQNTKINHMFYKNGMKLYKKHYLMLEYDKCYEWQKVPKNNPMELFKRKLMESDYSPCIQIDTPFIKYGNGETERIIDLHAVHFSSGSNADLDSLIRIVD